MLISNHKIENLVSEKSFVSIFHADGRRTNKIPWWIINRSNFSTTIVSNRKNENPSIISSPNHLYLEININRSNFLFFFFNAHIVEMKKSFVSRFHADNQIDSPFSLSLSLSLEVGPIRVSTSRGAQRKRIRFHRRSTFFPGINSPRRREPVEHTADKSTVEIFHRNIYRRRAHRGRLLFWIILLGGRLVNNATRDYEIIDLLPGIRGLRCAAHNRRVRSCTAPFDTPRDILWGWGRESVSLDSRWVE